MSGFDKCKPLCNPHFHIKIENTSSLQKFPHVPSQSLQALMNPWIRVLPLYYFCLFHINGIIHIQSLSSFFWSAQCFWDCHFLYFNSSIFSISQQYFIVYLSLFINSSLDVNKDYFHFLAIINKPVMRVLVQAFCGHMVSFLQDESLGVDLMGHRINTHLTFYKTANSLSKLAVPFYTPTGAWGFVTINIFNFLFFWSKSW